RGFIARRHLRTLRNFSLMALLTAVLAPMALLLIRNQIASAYGITAAGQWDGVTRLSGFYMLFFSSGLSLYYMPKLAGLSSDAEFRAELKHYFSTLVPLAFVLLGLVYLFRDLILKIAFSAEFSPVSSLIP